MKAAVLTLLFAGPVVACSCLPPPPPAEARDKSAAVFLAEVVKVEDATEHGRAVTLKVEKWWKGGKDAEIVVTTNKSSAACGYSFRKGGKYLVYAGQGENRKPLNVSLCSRTRTAEQAEKDGDFKALGEGKAP